MPHGPRGRAVAGSQPARQGLWCVQAFAETRAGLPARQPRWPRGPGPFQFFPPCGKGALCEGTPRDGCQDNLHPGHNRASQRSGARGRGRRQRRNLHGGGLQAAASNVGSLGTTVKQAPACNPRLLAGWHHASRCQPICQSAFALSSVGVGGQAPPACTCSKENHARQTSQHAHPLEWGGRK